MPRRNNVTTISISKDIKPKIENSIYNRKEFYNSWETWDDAMVYFIKLLDAGY